MRVNARRFGRYAAVVAALAFAAASVAGETKVVLLGTGNPGPDPDRSGPATAIVVNDTAYLVDFGPGVVRRARAAEMDRGIKALEPTRLRVAFVTHLHSASSFRATRIPRKQRSMPVTAVTC